MYTKPISVISGFSSHDLAHEVCEINQWQHEPVDTKRFNDKEYRVRLEESIRGTQSLVISSGTGHPSDVEKEARLLMRTAKRSGAGKPDLLIPYMTYGRSDQDFGQRGAPGLIDTIETYRPLCNNVFICDPHNGPVTKELFLSEPGVEMVELIHFAHLFAVQIEHTVQQGLMSQDNMMLALADTGGAKRLTNSFRRAIYSRLELDRDYKEQDWPQGIKDRHKDTGKLKIIDFTSDVKGKDVILFEDMIDSGTTACEIATFLKEKGARSVQLYATSGLFCTDHHDADITAIERINQSDLDLVVITDTYNYKKYKPHMAKAIADSPVIHKMQAAPVLAGALKAHFTMVTPDTPKIMNSISAILSGQHPDQAQFAKPVEIKAGNPLLELVS